MKDESGRARIDQVAFGGWENCWRLTDGRVEAVILADVGPRVIRLGLAGGPNMLCEHPEQWGLTGGGEFRVYGGHRFWHAPEDTVRTYQPDNAPAAVTLLPDDCGLRLMPPVEAATGMQKEWVVQLEASGTFRLTHRLHNRGLWPVEAAPWAITAMAPGGVALVPLPPRGPHPEFILPTSVLSLWPYTDLSDPRFALGREYLRLRAVAGAATPQKIGVLAPDGWAAYSLNGQMLVKRFAYHPGARYGDLGVNVELFTDADMLELETVGPLATIAPGASAEHVERWSIGEGLLDLADEAAIEQHVAARARELGDRL
jgi:hypothetical protein